MPSVLFPLASVVLLDFSVDGRAGFSYLLFDTIIFFGTSLPGLVKLRMVLVKVRLGVRRILTK